MSYTITLADGTKLENLEQIGNFFISHTPIDRKIFDGNLQHVKITCDVDDEETYHEPIQQGEYEYMILENFAHTIDHQFAYKLPCHTSESIDEETWQFYLRELTPEEKREMSFNARLDYLEMMTEVA